MEFDTNRKLAAEFIGTAGLIVVVVGSGIMAENLSKGNDGVALLANSIATGAGLFFLITAFINISGAHFNPAVTLVEVLSKGITVTTGTFFVLAQVLGGFVGTMIANVMFDLPIIQISTKERLTSGVFFSEILATFGLIGVILAAVRFDKKLVAPMVALYITGAYWFTSSTSFANPAVSIARIFTDTFTGIIPGHVPWFIVAQIFGAIIAMFVFGWLFKEKNDES